MQHISNQSFAALMNHLKDNLDGFEMKKLAEEMKCTYERLRRIKNEDGVLNVFDIEFLRKKYNVNELYFFRKKVPMFLEGPAPALVEQEANNAMEQQVIQLKSQLKDKEEIIRLLRMQLERKN